MIREIVARQCGEPPAGMQGDAHSLAWCADGKLALGSTDGWVSLWDVDSHGTCRVKSSVVVHDGKKCVEGLACHPVDKNQLATCCGDKSLKIWDLRSQGSPAQAHSADGETVNIHYSPDGRYIAMGSIKRATENSSEADIIGIYDVRAQKRLKSIKFDVEVTDFRWSPSGQYIINSTAKGYMEINMVHAPRAMSRVRQYVAHAGSCQGMALDPFNRFLACGGSEGLVSLWELGDFVCVRTIEGIERGSMFPEEMRARLAALDLARLGACDWAGIRALTFSHGGQFLAIASHSKDIQVADVGTGALASSIDLGTSCSALEWHLKRPILAGVVSPRTSRDSGLRVWSLQY